MLTVLKDLKPGDLVHDEYHSLKHDVNTYMLLISLKKSEHYLHCMETIFLTKYGLKKEIQYWQVKFLKI